MKALVITGSRADRNGLEVVHEALHKAGHESEFIYWRSDYSWMDGWEGDVAVVGGDRSEILHVALQMSLAGIPIAHIAGGDVTEGSADNRYRDAITALSCIHLATNQPAFARLAKLTHGEDSVWLTGSPAIDRIKQTPVLTKEQTFDEIGFDWDKPVALVCVHPNTLGDAPLRDYNAVRQAIAEMGLQCVWLGANADKGGDDINEHAEAFCRVTSPIRAFYKNVSPQIYYSLMTHCDVMVGNSSAGYYEAPCFGLPVVQVGDRQKGRMEPKNVVWIAPKADAVMAEVKHAVVSGRFTCDNPYGDGQSAPRIVKALEEAAHVER
jgi:UDP-hydrolysing UDP-N-acetyl-D-glucosamine 2-epimerase